MLDEAIRPRCGSLKMVEVQAYGSRVIYDSRSIGIDLYRYTGLYLYIVIAADTGRIRSVTTKLTALGV